MNNQNAYAGFWRRFWAVIIDYNIIAICLFPIFVALGFLIPDKVVVNVPYGLFSNEEILGSTSEKTEHSDGSVTVTKVSTIKKEVLGKWTYLYKETEKNKGEDKDSDRVLIDPQTKNELQKTEADDFIIILLILYYSLMESSKYMGTLGKLALGIKVTDENGEKLSFLRSLGRNAAKILSAFTLMIGFLMAGWTQKKQGLHDIISRCLITLK